MFPSRILWAFLSKTNSYVKQHANELQDIQIAIDKMEQYSRKTSLEFCGIPKKVDMLTDQVVCKIAEAIGEQIWEDDIEISHRIKRKRGVRPILAKFVSHKVKLKVYKARTKNLFMFQMFSLIALWKRRNALSISSSMKTWLCIIQRWWAMQ